MIEGEMMSVPEAATLCGVSRGTINNWIQTKRLFARRSGRNYSVRVTDLLIFLESMGKAIPPGLKNTQAKPMFKSFRHCWDYWEEHNRRNGCKRCVVSINKLAVCFTARNSNRLGCTGKCHECRYYQEIFFPRIQFILQMEIPAAVCKELYFWGVNGGWAEICGIPREAFIGMDIEKVIHPKSLGEIISILKKRKMGADFPASLPVSVITGAREKQKLSVSIFPMDEPSGSTLFLAKPGQDKTWNPLSHLKISADLK